MAIPRLQQQERPLIEGYQERLERLEQSAAGEPSAAAEAEAAVDALVEVAKERMLEPNDVVLTLAVDLTGEQAKKCTFCGRPSCGFRPTQYRVKNPELDLLGDTLTLFMEKVAERGFRYSLVAFDDRDVLVLREPAAPADQAERAQTLARYFAFRDRVDVPNSDSTEWMQEMLSKWTPSFATRVLVGEPQDRAMYDVALRMLGDRDVGAVRTLIVAKSQPPKEATDGAVARAKATGVELTGVAVGAQAEEVAARTAFPMTRVADFHGLRDGMTEWMGALAEQIAKTPLADG